MKRPLLALLLALGAVAGLSLAARDAAAQSPPTAIELLLRNARYWQARGREDKAVETMEKVLRSDPKAPEALATMVSFHARAGRIDKAREFLARLREAKGDPGEIPALERAIVVGKEFDNLLTEARALSKAGKPDEAVAVYRKIFGPLAPPRHFALEFYLTLAGSKEGWKEAKDGLAALAAKAPDEPVYRLAVARHLTYREEARREGINHLQKLLDDGAVSEDADAALRQALLWLRLQAGDEALLKAHLVRHPDDAEIKKRLSEPREGPARTEVKAGYEALDRADVKEADRLFRTAPKADTNPDALVGQGLVALKKEEWARAREIFTRVQKLAPGKPDIWERSLRSATFWQQLADAKAARAARREEESEQLLLAAIKTSPEERQFAEAALADLYLSLDQPEKAEARLRALLKERPDQPEGLRALVTLLLQKGRGDEASALNDKLTLLAPKLAYGHGALESELLRTKAVADIDAGRWELARQDLEASCAADPENRWALHDLANLHLELGEYAQARAALAKLTRLDPGMTQARAIQVRLLGAEGDPTAALELLGGLPPEQLTDTLRALRQPLEVKAEVERIVQRAVRDRRSDTGHDALLRLQQRVRAAPELELAVAQGWSALGESERAVALANEALLAVVKPTNGMRLSRAAILLRAGAEAQVQAALLELNNDPSLSPRERRDLAALRVAHGVRRADQQRESGEFAQAFNQLSPLLLEYPDNPRLLCSLGRLFESADKPADGFATFQRIVEDDPDDLEAREGAIRTAVARHDATRARRLAEDGLSRAPQNPRMLLVAARWAAQSGDDGEAMGFLQQAQVKATDELPKSPGLLDVAPGAGSLTPKSNTLEVLREGLLVFGKPAPVGGKRAAETFALQSEIQKDIDEVRDRHAVVMSPEPALRSRSGSPGLSQLTELSAPFNIDVPLGWRGKILLQVRPVILDAGAVDFADPLSFDRFGTAAPAPPEHPGIRLPQNDRGTAVSVGYREGEFSVDAGSTPLGFRVRNVVGGIRYRHEVGTFGFALEAFRRPVTDSLLSYAGMNDPATNTTWGGVLRNGGRVDLALNTESATFFVWAGFAYLNGTHVASNLEGRGGLGVEWKLYDWGNLTLVTGLSITGLGYQSNLRYYTLGQGGYFSPSAFVNTGVPFTFRGVAGKLRWELTGSPGVNWFHENSSRWFPLDTDLQYTREHAMDAGGAPLTASYGERSSTAFALSLSGRVAYPITSGLEGGLSFDLHQGDDFQEVTAGLFLRLTFRSRSQTTTPSGALPGPRAGP